MNNNNGKRKNRSATGPWAMRLQLIAGSYFLCMPKSWILSHVNPDTNLMIIEECGNNTLAVKPMAPQQNQNADNDTTNRD